MRVAIVGCGPAGLSAALLLHRQGHEVLIFERFETPGPVGSGIVLQPTGLAVLAELGCEDEVHALGKRIDLMRGLSMPSGKLVLHVNYEALGSGCHGLAVHRAALFEVLHARVVASGIPVHAGVDVRSEQDVLRVAGGSFDLLVDASGARSRLQHLSHHAVRWRELKFGALWGALDWPENGFDEHTLQQRYVGAHTMIGVLPIGTHSGVDGDQAAFFWSIRAQDYQQWLDDGLSSWKQKVIDIWPDTDVLLDQITDSAQMTLARYGHSTLRQPFGPRIAFIGDAAHATSPQLGQGANMALLDAWALAAAIRGSGDLSDALRQYTANRRWHVRAFQLSSLALTPFYQSDSRVLAATRDLLFHPVSKLPVARRIVAGLISGLLARPPKDLLCRRGLDGWN